MSNTSRKLSSEEVSALMDGLKSGEIGSGDGIGSGGGIEGAGKDEEGLLGKGGGGLRLTRFLGSVFGRY